MRASLKILVASLLVTLAVAAPAFAQTSPTQQGYSLSGGVTETQVEKTTTQQAASDNELPFTGMELVIVLGLGVGLLGAGFAVRRLARPTV
jgi:hypothetical protein